MRHLLAAAAALFSITAAASANTITVGLGLGSLTCNGATAGQCQAFIGAGANGAPTIDPTGLGTLSSTSAGVYDGTPSGENAEAARLSTLTGLAFTGASGLRSVSNPPTTFATVREWLVMKLGNDSIFIRNTSGGALTIAYASTPGAGSGLSHYTEFGGVVPLPAAAWMMLAGIGGLAAARGRKKQA